METATESHSQGEIILEFIEDGCKRIEYSNNENIVFYLGNTGAGKSTTTQLIHGSLSNLESIEPESEEFLIKDLNDKISSSDSITSKTFVPDLLYANEKGVSYYDCPGFSDNRSPSHDIAASYFIKKVLDPAKSVKFVLVVSYTSLRPGVNKDDFLKLIKNIVTMVKDVNKFEEGLALIVTKVDNVYNSKCILQSDDIVKEKIVNFMKNVKKNLSSIIEGNTNMFKDYYPDAIRIIDIFLRKQGKFQFSIFY